MKNTARYLFLAIFPLITFGISAPPAYSLPPGSGKLYYVHNDPTGTPQALTDESGNVVWSAETDPFGGSKVNEDPDGDGQLLTFNIRAPGQYFDQETGLHYNYFRHYDPQTGRYLTSDPIGLVGGLNTYGYVLGNPISYIDPIGAGPLSGAAAGGFCLGLSAGGLINTFDSLDSLEEEVDQLNELINTAENACSIGERPEWFQEYIDRLKRDRLKLVKEYLRQNGNILPTQAGRILTCGAVGGILTALPFIP